MPDYEQCPFCESVFQIDGKPRNVPLEDHIRADHRKVKLRKGSNYRWVDAAEMERMAAQTRFSWTPPLGFPAPCHGCGSQIKAGERSAVVIVPPDSLNDVERRYRYHNGQCIASWAQQRHLDAQKAIRTKSADYRAHPLATETRARELQVLEAQARVWSPVAG
ncbi:MAG TPA: hypothetical protein VGU43_07440 [Thermoplasmata archaeon]|nr:hypothetical protein [Thermoplasmata archaeon]